MRVSRRCKLLPPALLALLTLVGCRLPPHVPTTAPAAPAAPAAPGLAPHLGTPYEVVPDASLLTIRVYRAGALASAGHNHVIASHELSGTVFLPQEVLRSSFELHLPVTTLTVDEPALRAQAGAGEFPPDVSEGAKEGTRRNMLGAALLDAGHYPEIVLSVVRLEQSPAGAATPSGAPAVVAWVQSSVRGQQRIFSVPLCYRLGDGVLSAAGEFPLRQSELGLTPFSALLGALQVQDEMHVSFHIVARRAATHGAVSAAPAPPATLPPDTPCAAPRA
jgi:hypothetical protein